MKKIIIASAIVFIAANVQAQNISSATGKKLQVATNMKMTTTVSQMGQEMEIPTVGDINTDYEVKSVAGKTVSLTGTTKKIKVTVSAMGQEQTADSDDPAAANNPQMAEAFKDVNKTKDLTVQVGKPLISSDVTGVQGTEDIAAVLFFPIDIKLKEGTSFSDSTTNADGSNSVSLYTVSKATPQEITLTVANTAKMLGTKQQMGMEVKVNMQTASTATRVYDAASGVLKSESKQFTSTGTNEVMGQSIPVSMKGSSTITVK